MQEDKITLKKDIAYYGSERRDLFSMLPDKINSVLDVGCGSGNFGKSLKDIGASKVVGIEINSLAAEKAKGKIDKVFVIDMDNYHDELGSEKFDLIIFADVLEHLKDPWALLKQMILSLNNQGAFLISIPNIRYYRVLLNLIFKGEFHYEPDGILDIGHLRFFTFKSSTQYLKGIGLEIVRIKRNFSGQISWLFNALTFNIFSDFFTRQYIILARKKTGAVS